MLKPGDTIGILGGGQLGRMIALSCAQLGLKTHILCPEADSPAFQVSDGHICAAYDDEAALAELARVSDVVTYEFENVPLATAEFLRARVPVRPGPRALEVSQDRLVEKAFVRDLGIETAPFAPVESLAELEAAVAAIGLPAVLKTRRFGYDGKGQVTLRSGADLAAAWEAIGRQRGIACKIAGALDYVGVFAVELFVAESGLSERLIVNEIAPRVHNSGHWTMDGAITSQFEQHVRAIAGWPLGDTARRGRVQMLNLIGDDVDTWQRHLADPAAHLHLYGKAEARPGRKMGHVNRLLDREPAGC
ncbi:MAG: 5-(carboxyamino)imidazole ribonucleotide synthase [Azorhizobium sp. 32-67-21]|nr:MAG: 5-(carboxyamino)imidazole ribonucleotide synthase [Azorhizobium sp. 32-67-21]